MGKQSGKNAQKWKRANIYIISVCDWKAYCALYLQFAICKQLNARANGKQNAWFEKCHHLHGAMLNITMGFLLCS